MAEINFSSVPPAALEELNRQAELCLQGTIALATASDQRAVTLTGVFGAAAGAVATLAGGLLAGAHSPPGWFLVGAFIAAALFLVATILCALSAQPSDFFVAGYEPRFLILGCDGDNLNLIRSSALEDLQMRINHNRKQLERAAKLLTCGLWLGALALPATALGLIAYLAIQRPF